MRVLAYDPGEERIGFAVINNNPRIDIIATGKLTSTKNKVKASRKIYHLIERYSPDIIAYEETGSFLKGIYADILKQAIEIYHISVLAFKVSDVRQLLYNDPYMSKQGTHFILKNKFPILKVDISRDELDAISIALAALNEPMVK